jgi:cell wall-associated NlpC family hydrolase
LRAPFVGLFLSIALGCAVAPAVAGPIKHTIVPGDSLWSIASRYHVSVAALEARNGLTDASVLQLGQTIVVSETASAPRQSVTSQRSHVGPKTSRRVQTHHLTHRSTNPMAMSAAPSSATSNAMWAATHTGEAAGRPATLSFSLAERIVAFDAQVTRTALRYVGVPYVWGGTSFSGVDCSGFVQSVFEHNGISLPRTADSQFEVGHPVKMRNLRAGDLVFFETYAAGASHVGIYLGGGQFVHASSSNGVRVDYLTEEYYAARYIGARRLGG